MFRLRKRSTSTPAYRQVGGPDQDRFAYPISFYMDAYRSYRAAVAVIMSEPLGGEVERCVAVAQLRERRARATWAIANGGTESIPSALEMLGSANLDERDDARGILRQMGSRDQVVDSVIALLGQANDQSAIAAVTVALGEMMNPRAIPSLGRILAGSRADANTRSLAITSLGRLAQRRFDRSDDPEAAAFGWLRDNGYFSPQFGIRQDPGPERIISTA